MTFPPAEGPVRASNDIEIFGLGLLPASHIKEVPMSALGQKQTSAYVRVTSALPPKADIAEKSARDYGIAHMHPDHSAGLSDPASGRRYFSNAELVVHENEPPHWFDDAAMARASERQQRLYFMCAREQIKPYKDRTRLFQKGEVFPGVTAIPCHGHTPGHTSFLISSGNEQLLIWGDTVHVPEIQTARPEVCMEFDTDPDAAAVTRRRVFDMVATDRLAITGMHLHFPGFAHLVRRGSGYQLIPEAWEQTL